MNVARPLASGAILRFWTPLAATWVMMSLEGPVLAATIARLPDPKANLAAYGIAFSIAILVEAPVMMIMSAATALVRDRASYKRLRTFSHGLNAASTLMLGAFLIPAVFDALVAGLLSLPDDVADLAYGALWIFLPWPTAIGYRRFVHGVMIREGETRRVAVGTVCRLAAMTGTAAGLFSWSDLPGAWVGPASLSAGVCFEAVAARWMGRSAIRRALARAEPSLDDGGALSLGGIARFYTPLAMTSLLGLATHPMLTFFMGRAAAPLESLAVFPVVHALSFLFRSVGISYQEAAIALLGDDPANRRPVARFAAFLAAACSAGLALFAFTPLFGVWFETISGLTAELASYARVPAIMLVPLPALSVWMSYQRAVKVLARETKAITVATALEVSTIALLFAALGWGLGMVGVTAAVVAFLGGRLVSNLYLHR